MRTDQELERELEYLAGLVKPPASVVDRVMELIDAERVQAERPISFRAHLLRAYQAVKPIPKLLSAAASIAIVAAVVWGLRSGSGNGMVWADVARNIQEAHTMVGWSMDGSARYRFYVKDPGLWRSERYAGVAASQPAAEEAPEGLEIGTYTETGRQWVAWYPGSKRVIHNRFVGCPHPPPCEAAMYWITLKKIGSDDARKVGEEQIGSVQTVVFEAPIRAAFAGIEKGMPDKGTVRVWVSKDTKVPVRVDTLHGNPPTGEFHGMVTDLDWNVPLADELFQLPTFDDGWTSYDICHVCFSNHTLKQGVKVSLGPAGGPPIVTEADIEQIESGMEANQNPPGAIIKRDVTLRWTKTAADRIVEYAKAHAGVTLVLAFDGRIQSKVEKDWTAPGVAQGIGLNIASLGITLEQFEQDYLTAGQ